MAKYIEREKVLGTIDELQRICATEVPEDKAEIYNDVFEEVYGEITRISAADVRPERHGEWIEESNGYKCSECGKLSMINAKRNLTHFCPNCIEAIQRVIDGQRKERK